MMRDFRLEDWQRHTNQQVHNIHQHTDLVEHANLLDTYPATTLLPRICIRCRARPIV